MGSDFILFIYLFILHWVSLHSHDCPGTHYVDQAVLKLTICLPSAGIKSMYRRYWAYLLFSYVFFYMYGCFDCVPRFWLKTTAA